MKLLRPRSLFPLGALLALTVSPAGGAEPEPSPTALVIHGGAGTLRRADMTADLERRYRAKLSEALRLGHQRLARGDSSLDTVEAVVRLLEDSPLFNAGKGAVFTADGRNELDASIMDGASRRAGAVAGVTTLRHPISAARAVMERSPHVLLSGEGAEAFARSVGLETVDPKFFWTERRWRALERARQREQDADDDQGAGKAPAPPSSAYFGTVGAVALDRQGRLAAGTSTGGMTNKRHGRIGDSPIIGAGTYADESCGVSSTGHGEYFIRYSVAYDICARLRYEKSGIAEAARATVLGVLQQAGGSGGVIALDSRGTPALVFNSEGMYRGRIGADGQPHVAIYKDE